MKKVLMTTIQKPFGIENELVLAERYHVQVTAAQEFFSLRSVYRGWGLEFIPRNLKTPTVKRFLKIGCFMKIWTF